MYISENIYMYNNLRILINYLAGDLKTIMITGCIVLKKIIVVICIIIIIKENLIGTF